MGQLTFRVVLVAAHVIDLSDPVAALAALVAALAALVETVLGPLCPAPDCRTKAHVQIVR